MKVEKMIKKYKTGKYECFSRWKTYDDSMEWGINESPKFEDLHEAEYKLVRRKSKLKEELEESNRKLNIANKSVHDQINYIDELIKENRELKVNSEITENHMQIAERELSAKERLIIELKDWITTLIKAER